MENLKKSVFLFCLFIAGSAIAQVSPLMPGAINQGMLMGGLGVSIIDGQSYLALNFYPEFAFGKVGVGMRIPLRFNLDTGELRNEDWDETYDYFRIIRFVRYGYKHEPVYARVGELDAARIGHGFIMNFYNNNIINYDRRKIGLVLDLDAGVAGFESMTSNLGRGEIFGARAYYRPLYEQEIPILRNFAVAASYVTDIDPDRDRNTDDNIVEFGLDVELPVIKTSLLQTLLYVDFAKISGHGSGKAVGVELTLRGAANTFALVAQLERRFLGSNFLPGYFNAFYEIDRFRVENGVAMRKQDLLAKTTATRGTFGLLRGIFVNMIDVWGTFERLDGVANSGILHLHAEMPKTLPRMRFRASYDKTGIDSFSDAFKIDSRSVARLGIGYSLNAFVVLYMDYIWTYRLDETTNQYKIQKRIEPQLAIVYQFPIGRQR